MKFSGSDTFSPFTVSYNIYFFSLDREMTFDIMGHEIKGMSKMEIVYYVTKKSVPYVVAAENSKTIEKIKPFCNEVDPLSVLLLGLPESPYLMETTFDYIRGNKEIRFKEVEDETVSFLVRKMTEIDPEDYTKAKEIMENYRRKIIDSGIKRKKTKFNKKDKEVDKLLSALLGASMTKFDTNLAKRNDIFKLEDMFVQNATNKRNAYMEMVEIYKSILKNGDYSDYYIRNILSLQIYNAHSTSVVVDLFHEGGLKKLVDEYEFAINNSNEAFKAFCSKMEKKVGYFGKEDGNQKVKIFENYLNMLDSVARNKQILIYCKDDKYSYNPSVFHESHPVYIMALEIPKTNDDGRMNIVGKASTEMVDPDLTRVKVARILDSKEVDDENSSEEEKEKLRKEREKEEILAKLQSEEHKLDSLYGVPMIMLSIMNSVNPEKGVFHFISSTIFGFSGSEEEAISRINIFPNREEPELHNEKKTMYQSGIKVEDITDEELEKMFVEKEEKGGTLVEEG